MAFAYQGSELEVFAHARNWKRYFSSWLAPYILGDVLEVGAGLGETARTLCDGRQTGWTSLEPDPALAREMQQRFLTAPLPAPHRITVGKLSDLPSGSSFDTIVYIDVLEHIEDDRGELQQAAGRLRRGGRLIVLAPAFQLLYTPFDHAVGHFRRYSAESLAGTRPESLQQEKLFYLDSAGLVASLANLLLLRSAHPTLAQIRFWDTVLVPVSRVLDPVIFHRAGRSIVAVLRAPLEPGG